MFGKRNHYMNPLFSIGPAGEDQLPGVVEQTPQERPNIIVYVRGQN